MDQLTRNDAKRRLEGIRTELSAAHDNMDNLPISAILECVAQSRASLNEVAVSLLICHLREQFGAGEPIPDEEIVEGARAVLSRFFDIL